jgi:hypothetical protein
MTQDEQTTCPICAAPLLPDDICATDIEMGICHAACLDGSPVVDLETGAPTAGPIDTFRYGDLDGATAPEDPNVTAARAAFKLFRKAARKDRKWPTTVRTAFYAGHIAATGAFRHGPETGEAMPDNASETAGGPARSSQWSGWDQSNTPWSVAKHQDAVCHAVFGVSWSLEDAHALISAIDRALTPTPVDPSTEIQPSRYPPPRFFDSGVADVAFPSTYSMRWYDQELNKMGPVFSIHPDGRVEIGEGMTKDDAAKAFWDYVISVDPRGRIPPPVDRWQPIETAPAGQQMLVWEPLYGWLIAAKFDDAWKLKSSGNFWMDCPSEVVFKKWARLDHPDTPPPSDHVATAAVIANLQRLTTNTGRSHHTGQEFVHGANSQDVVDTMRAALALLQGSAPATGSGGSDHG